jgi:hypothetical protein
MWRTCYALGGGAVCEGIQKSVGTAQHGSLGTAQHGSVGTAQHGSVGTAQHGSVGTAQHGHALLLEPIGGDSNGFFYASSD